ncbi:MAG: Gfo/Idh/MocA family oxidoreductase [Parvularculaceae bacterium]|nr:Gfo/Idh/MocA family oxidoreductase [Parvularculaceae bacterium]
MKSRLKTGVVGAGVFGAFHAAKHAASERAELVGLYDIDAGRARELADRVGVTPFADYPSLLKSVDAIVIASPAPTHFRFAKAALEAGLHVYVEKPLAMSVAEADALIAIAERKSLILQVGHQERFVLSAIGLPLIEVAPKKLEFSRCGPPSGRGEDVSVVFDLMIHDLDIARFFGFADPKNVSACGDRHETIATLEFDHGRSCSFIASRRAEERRRHLRIEYEQGRIEIDFMARRVTDATPRPGSVAIANTAAAFADPLAESVEAFFASVLDGARTMVDGKAGRAAIDWATAIDLKRNSLIAAEQADRMIA